METQKNQIIVAFHIGRGGHYWNPGHLTYIGEKDFNDIVNLNPNHIFFNDRDKKGRFCRPYITDCSGNRISETDDFIIGRLDFDGRYNTDYCKYIADCSETEINCIVNDIQYKSSELVNWLESNNSKLHFDKYGMLIKETI